MATWNVTEVSEDGSKYAPLGQVEAESKEEALHKASDQYDVPENDLLVERA